MYVCVCVRATESNNYIFVYWQCRLRETNEY